MRTSNLRMIVINFLMIRNRFGADHMGSCVRIPLKAWMSVCVYSVFVLSSVGSGLATGWSPDQRVLTTVLGLRNWSETKISRSKVGATGKREREYIFKGTVKVKLGRALAQAVSRWLPTAAARVRSRVWSSGISGGQSGAGAGFPCWDWMRVTLY
jgi:hypothetical protein